MNLRVAIVGCGRMGEKRAAALGADTLLACVDHDVERSQALALAHGAQAVRDVEEVLALRPDIVVIATTHDALAPTTIRALGAGAHVLVEKPAGMRPGDVDQIGAAARRAGRLVKVGFNHRFHPALGRAVEAATSGTFGPIMYIRGRYGHGGRPGYDREWRADPAISGGGELLDQGMHLLDLCYWAVGPMPLHSALLRTSYWDMPVEDNAALLLGAGRGGEGPWATLHVSWSEWKNEFAFEIYCRKAKIQVTGLGGSYGPERLRIWRMRPEMGPPDLEETVFDGGDVSWAHEWAHFRSAIDSGSEELLGDLASARYGLETVAAAYDQESALMRP